MREFSDNLEGCDACDSIESLVRSACGYVQPSDDLRPRTLEAARAACRQKRWNSRIGSLSIAILLLALCGFPHWSLSSRAQQVAQPSDVIRHFDLHEQASLRMLHAGFEPSWAVFEAFAELRKKQADLFGGAM